VKRGSGIVKSGIVNSGEMKSGKWNETATNLIATRKNDISTPYFSSDRIRVIVERLFGTIHWLVILCKVVYA